MAVLRKEKVGNYTVIDNAIFKDKDISLKAIGLLCVMLALPDNWDYSIAGLVSIVKDGESAVRSTLQELEDAGYFRREQVRVRGKITRIEYVISEYKNCEKPLVENPQQENPQLENRGQVNTKELNTKESNTKSSSLRSEDIYSELPKNLKEALRDFEDMRKLKKKPMTNKARKMLLDRLESLSGGNTEVKIAMLNQSIENAWTSVYELKEQDNGKGNNFGAGGKGKGKTDRGIGDSDGEVFRFPDA